MYRTTKNDDEDWNYQDKEIKHSHIFRNVIASAACPVETRGV